VIDKNQIAKEFRYNLLGELYEVLYYNIPYGLWEKK